jgi:hypothetical protein
MEVETWPSGVGLPLSPLLVMKLLPASLISRSGPESPSASGTTKAASASEATAIVIVNFMMIPFLPVETLHRAGRSTDEKE